MFPPIALFVSARYYRLVKVVVDYVL